MFGVVGAGFVSVAPKTSRSGRARTVSASGSIETICVWFSVLRLVAWALLSIGEGWAAAPNFGARGRWKENACDSGFEGGPPCGGVRNGGQKA
uniref:Secreted protein n=1 Tax=Romanomermis culicivorax TaxID=13658 RepID=A0A915K810_ROMCU